MAANMRKAVGTVTHFVFPVPKSSEQQELYLLKAGNQEYVSSLPLQIALYFNVFYFPFWILSEIVMLVAKFDSLDTLYKILFDSLDTLYKILVIAIYVCMTIVELIRIYIGYVGNLSEKVPELAGFWLLTLLLQTPFVLFVLFNEATIITPLERAVTVIMAAFIVFEDVVGYFAIRAMVSSQVNKFHLQQFTNLEQVEDLPDDDSADSAMNRCRHPHTA